MIQMQSKLEVADNTGARSVQCIKVLAVQNVAMLALETLLRLVSRKLCQEAESKKVKSMMLL